MRLPPASDSFHLPSYAVWELILERGQNNNCEAFNVYIRGALGRFAISGPASLRHVVVTVARLRWARWKADGCLLCSQDFTFKYDALEDFDS